MWDVTCPDTYAQSLHSTNTAGHVAEQAEKKAEKYAHLAPAHQFQPVAIETSGVIGPTSTSFLKELGRRLTAATGEAQETLYLLQRLSVAVQRGNTAAVLGTTPGLTDLNLLTQRFQFSFIGLNNPTSHG